jgi:hypothetical protein
MRLQFLGAPEDVDLKAWEAYLVALRNKLTASLNEMLGAYRTLRKIRESFGMPLVARTSEASASPGALTESEYQQILELASMVDLMNRALDDVVGSKRKFGFDRATNDFQIERLPTDANRIEVRGGRPTLISNSTNQPVQVSGTIDGLGVVGPIVWVGLAIIGTAVTLGTLYTVNTALEKTADIVQSNTQKTIAIQSMKLVEQGKATPAEAKALQTATYEAAKDLEIAKGEAAAKTTGLTPDTNKTIRTVAIVAAIGGAIYLIAKIIPERAPRIIPAT